MTAHFQGRRYRRYVNTGAEIRPGQRRVRWRLENGM